MTTHEWGTDAAGELSKAVPGLGESVDAELRVLVLMRHAQAQPTSDTGDFGRALHRDGRAVARQAGQWLLSQGVRFDVVVVSPSIRTLQTWEELNRAGVRADDLWSDAALYDGDREDVIESVGALPDDARVVAVVGHMPAIPMVVAALSDHVPAGDPHPDEGWHPGALAVVSHKGPWSHFPDEQSAVVAFRPA